jgi:hypothetical protein
MAALARELRACLAEADGEVPAAPPEDDAALTLVTRPAPASAHRRRSRRRPLLYALLALVVAGAAFAAVLLLGGASHHHGGSGGGGSPGSVVKLSGVGDYNPSPSKDSHADTAGAATDGDAATPWITQIYGSPDFGGLMAGYGGLGLLLDAGSSVKLTQLAVQTPTPGFTAQILAGDSSTGDFAADSSKQTVSGGTKTFTLSGKTARYYVVWITSLPSTSSGYRAEISEVTARG